MEIGPAAPDLLQSVQLHLLMKSGCFGISMRTRRQRQESFNIPVLCQGRCLSGSGRPVSHPLTAVSTSVAPGTKCQIFTTRVKTNHGASVMAGLAAGPLPSRAARIPVIRLNARFGHFDSYKPNVRDPFRVPDITDARDTSSSSPPCPRQPRRSRPPAPFSPCR